jgi:hypothetical protein
VAAFGAALAGVVERLAVVLKPSWNIHGT